MNDSTNHAVGATLKLSEKTIQSLRDSWRAAGGVTYSAPKGQMAAMAEPKLFAFLSEFLLSADRTAVDRSAPATSDLSLRLDRVESELFHLVRAICPGLDSGDLIADAGVARAAMASAEPVAHFQCETGEDGMARYQNVQERFNSEPDVFPLYRRAPTVAELAAHIDQHQVADTAKVCADVTPAADQSAAKATPAAKKAGTK